MVVLVLGGFTVVGIAIWVSAQSQLEDARMAIAAVPPAATSTIDPKDRLGLEKDRLQSENAVRATVVQYFGSVAQLVLGLAGLGALYFTWLNLRQARQEFAQATASTARTLDLTERGQAAERFTKAIGQLGDEQLAVRLGGIYALERLANDAPDPYHWTVVEVLTAFVRERARRKAGTGIATVVEVLTALALKRASKDAHGKSPATDVQAALSVLGQRRHRGRETEEQRLNLSATDLSGADLREAHLEGASFRGALLEATDFREAHLEKADFTRTTGLWKDCFAGAYVDETVFGPRFARQVVRVAHGRPRSAAADEAAEESHAQPDGDARKRSSSHAGSRSTAGQAQ